MVCNVIQKERQDFEFESCQDGASSSLALPRIIHRLLAYSYNLPTALDRFLYTIASFLLFVPLVVQLLSFRNINHLGTSSSRADP